MNVSDFINRKVAIILIISAVIAIIINALIAAVAVAHGVDPTFHPLTFPFYSVFSLLGLVAGWVGWRIVELRWGYKPLYWLVPVVLILSYIPDISILFIHIIPDTTLAGVLGLMTMHIVVVACGLPAYVRSSQKLK